MSSLEFSGLVALAVIAGSALVALPIIVACQRDIDERRTIVLVSLFLGWTVVGWLCVLVLALSLPRRVRYTSPPAPQPLGPDPYREGTYLVSAGADSHTWAVHTAGQWRIVYEVAGTERLCGAVSEADVPLGVLAEALERIAS
jgi:hypothetical protein